MQYLISPCRGAHMVVLMERISGIRRQMMVTIELLMRMVVVVLRMYRGTELKVVVLLVLSVREMVVLVVVLRMVRDQLGAGGIAKSAVRSALFEHNVAGGRGFSSGGAILAHPHHL